MTVLLDNRIYRDDSLSWRPLGDDIFWGSTNFRGVFLKVLLFFPKVEGEDGVGPLGILVAPPPRGETGRYEVRPVDGEGGLGSRATEGLWCVEGNLMVVGMTESHGATKSRVTVKSIPRNADATRAAGVIKASVAIEAAGAAWRLQPWLTWP